MTGFESYKSDKIDVDAVLAEFDGKKDLLAQFSERTKSLIEEFLKDQTIRYQSVQARVKSRDKLKIKYLDQDKDYKQLSDITDQVALRIITYYEDEVDLVADLIRREFTIDLKNSVDKRATEPDKFGYWALNYVCKYSSARTSQVEYKKFKDQSCEIQITSILRHAWSEIQHPWYDLKDAFPSAIKRRFARMAALLEIAESEFLSLRNAQANYRGAIEIQVEADLPNVQIDEFSLRSFLEREPLVAELDTVVATILKKPFLGELADKTVESRLRVATQAGLTRINDLRESLKKFKIAIPAFVLRCRDEVWPSTSTSYLTRGVCIYHLALILVGLRGEDATLGFLTAISFSPTWNVTRQVEIAREIATRYAIRI